MKLIQMKKILTLVAALSLVASLAVGGSIAYLQDTDQAVNVMTLGNVYIEQIEQERAEDGTLQDFTQAKPLLPSAINTTTWEGWDWDTTIVRMTQVGSYGGMQVFAGKNAQDKFVTVQSTGKSVESCIEGLLGICLAELSFGSNSINEICLVHNL